MMEIQPKFQILYTEEAVEFLESLEEKARAKVVYNIGKCRYPISAFCFLGYRNRDCCRCYTRDSEEDPEDPGKGDRQG